MGCSESGVLVKERQGVLREGATGVRESRVLMREGGFGEKGGVLGRARWMFRRKGTIFKGRVGCSGVKGFKEGRGFWGKGRGFREGEMDV